MSNIVLFWLKAWSLFQRCFVQKVEMDHNMNAQHVQNSDGAFCDAAQVLFFLFAR